MQSDSHHGTDYLRTSSSMRHHQMAFVSCHNSSRNSTNTLSQLEPKPTAILKHNASFRIHYHIPASLLNRLCELGATPSSPASAAASSAPLSMPPPTSLAEAQAQSLNRQAMVRGVTAAAEEELALRHKRASLCQCLLWPA